MVCLLAVAAGVFVSAWGKKKQHSVSEPSEMTFEPTDAAGFSVADKITLTR